MDNYIILCQSRKNKIMTLFPFMFDIFTYKKAKVFGTGYLCSYWATMQW